MTAARARAVAAVVPGGVGPVEVLGDTELAESVRDLLGTEPADGRAPGAIVDVTGDPDIIASALNRLADLGTLVLAATVPPGQVNLDLYPDLHVRGLVVVGVPE